MDNNNPHTTYRLIKEKVEKDPFMLQGTMLEIIRNWFKENVPDYTWSANKGDSKIAIEPSYQFTPESYQNRPGIYVDDVSINSRGLGRIGMDDLKVVQNAQGISQYATLPVADLNIYPISSAPGEVIEICKHVYFFLLYLSPVIKKDFKFLAFEPKVVNKIGKIEEYTDFWTKPINIQIIYSCSWKIEQVSPKIKLILNDVITTLSSDEYS